MSAVQQLQKDVICCVTERFGGRSVYIVIDVKTQFCLPIVEKGMKLPFMTLSAAAERNNCGRWLQQ